MPAWVAVSVVAAFLQNLRSALQKTLTPRVGVLGATYARFLFAAPLAAGLVALLALREPLPRVTAGFVGWGLAGAGMQVGATLMLLRVFSLRNFAVGNTFAKTETVQAGLFGLVLLGDRLGALALLGIVGSLAGIVLLSTLRVEGRRAFDRAAGLGILSGSAFALSAVAYRVAALALGGEPGALMRPAFTLACVTLVQALVMGGGLAVAARGTIGAVLRAWRVAVPVGAAGMLASLGWFVALTVATAAQVKAVGQVELLFSWLTARYAFGELPALRETLGIALVAGGIVAVVLAG